MFNEVPGRVIMELHGLLKVIREWGDQGVGMTWWRPSAVLDTDLEEWAHCGETPRIWSLCPTSTIHFFSSFFRDYLHCRSVYFLLILESVTLCKHKISCLMKSSGGFKDRLSVICFISLPMVYVKNTEILVQCFWNYNFIGRDSMAT